MSPPATHPPLKPSGPRCCGRPMNVTGMTTAAGTAPPVTVRSRVYRCEGCGSGVAVPDRVAAGSAAKPPAGGAG